MQNQISDVEFTEKLRNKRNSGLFSFLKSFLSSSTSCDSIDSVSTNNSLSGSTDSLHSATSIGTLASFSYLSPALYTVPIEKRISTCPETNTSRDRLKQCDNRRESEKNISLTKKYNLFISTGDIKKEEVIFLDKKEQANELDNCKSLPLMTRKKTTENDVEYYKNGHRRTNSDSFKNRKSGVYLHVKGKKKAPQPPMLLKMDDHHSRNTFGLLRRKYNTKKYLAPSPPPQTIASASSVDLIPKENIESNATLTPSAEIIFNDQGILKPTKEKLLPFSSCAANNPISESINNSSNRSQRINFVKSNTPTDILKVVTPKPWFKLSSISSDIVTKNEENRYEPIVISSTKYDKKNNKGKTGWSFLTNISQLDKEATEIFLKKDQKTNIAINEVPDFMASRNNVSIKNDDITNITKAKLTSSPLGSNKNVQQKVSKWQSIFHVGSDEKHNTIQNKDKAEKVPQTNKNPLMKLENACMFKVQPDLPPEQPQETINLNTKTTWFCKKCQTENDYWRIICYKCSAMKSYSKHLLISSSFHNMIANTSEMDKSVHNGNINASSKNTICNFSDLDAATSMNVLARSKTEIGFSVLTSRNKNRHAKTMTKSNIVSVSTDGSIKKDERERLKQMLIDMKNSLPNRRNIELNRKNTLDECPNISVTDSIIELKKETKLVSETSNSYTKENKPQSSEIPKTTEVILLTSQIVYENVKVKNYCNTKVKPLNVSTSVQTNAVVRKPLPISLKNLISSVSTSDLSTEPCKSIYNDCKDDSKNNTSYTQHLIKPPNANENAFDDIFINLPKRENLLNEITTEFLAPVAGSANVADTLETNRLLKRLETAIAQGNLIQASEYAKDLAQLKVNCSVVRQKSTQKINEIYPNDGKIFTISLFVEDRLSHRGPFPIQVEADYTVLQLKELVAKQFEIPVNIQKWILGRELAVNNSKTLQEYNVGNGCAVFLYLHTTESNKSTNKFTQNEDSKTAIHSEHGDIVKKPIEYCHHQFTDKEVEEYDTELQEMKNCFEQSKISTNQIDEWLPENHNAKNITTYSAIRKLVILDKEQNNSNVPVLDTVPKSKYNNINVIEKVVSHRNDITRLNEQQLKDGIISPIMQVIVKPGTKLNEWACQICTLLNPEITNICGLCANIRRNKPATINHTGRETFNEMNTERSRLHYQELVNLENADLIMNNASFECLICLHRIKSGAGAILRECLHQFCKACLANAVQFCEDVEVKCPFRDEKYACDMALQIREIKALVTKSVYDQFLARSVKQAENKSQKSFHCRTPDCEGWCLYEDNVNQFRCPVCNKMNCLTCQAIHESMDCRQYQNELHTTSMDNEDTHRTRVMLDDMVRAGDALHCPACRVVLMKKWGCDWVRCTVCKTEICWVTRGARWGPGGKGDISGGCKCGVNGVKCHPHCSYCH